MKNKKHLVLWLAAIGLLFSNNVDSISQARTVKRLSGSVTASSDPTQFVGYGYNVTAGKAICEPDALMLNNPILDTKNIELINATTVFDASKTVYVNDTSSSVSEIAESYAQTIGGGAHVQGKISAVNVDVGAKFNTSKGSSWTNTASEEYSYFSIFAQNREVVIQLSEEKLTTLLNENFKKDLYAVTSEEQALELFKKYGTHLLTGYTLGGIFEMTNYYATNSSSYVRQNNTSFDTQVTMGLGSYANAGTDFSFTQQFGYSDNNSYAINKYKCTTYGGVTFPGLTIDQAFSQYTTLTDSGYLYKIWTDSINCGTSLVIVNVPQSSKMIGLWDLLPSTQLHQAARMKILNAYMNLCKETYTDYIDIYKDVIPEEKKNLAPVEENTSFTDNGFMYSCPISGTKYYTSMINADEVDVTEAFSVKANSVISMNYSEDLSNALDLEWTTNDSHNIVQILDKEKGVFKIQNTSNVPGVSFDLILNSNNGEIFRRSFKYSQSTDFSGGDGSETSPYIISSADEYQKFSTKSQYWDSDCYIKLVCDIDIGDCVSDISVVGTDDKAFMGTFDGGYHKIYNATLQRGEFKNSTALFGRNAGTIKNVRIFDTDAYYVEEKSTVFGKATALLCAENLAGGEISNCEINNSVLSINHGSTSLSTTSSTKTTDNIAYALACGINEGKVSNIKIASSSLIITENAYDEAIVAAGTAIGLQKGEESETKKIDVSSCVDQVILNNGAYLFVGGVFGEISGGDIEKIVARDFKGKYNAKARILADGRGDTDYTYAGGLAGYMGDLNKGLSSDEIKQGGLAVKTSLSECIVYNTNSINSIYTTTQGIAQGAYNGLFIGSIYSPTNAQYSYKNNYLDVRTDASFTKNILRYVSNSAVTKDSWDINKYGSIVNINENGITWNALNNDIKSNADDWKNENGVPVINMVSILSEYFNADFSSIDKTYYISQSKSEYFKFGLINFDGLYSNGEEFTTSDCIIDLKYIKRADKSELLLLDTKGEYRIIVELYGVQFEYTIGVKDAQISELYVIDVEKDGVINYGGMKPNYSNYEVHALYQNGEDAIIDNNDCTFECGTLKNGNNTATVTYNGVSAEFNVYGNKRDVEKIELEGTVDGTYGTSDINTKNLKVKAYYKDDLSTPVEVDLKECEVINSVVSYGENVVYVCYDGYNMSSAQFAIENPEINSNAEAFILKMNDIIDPKDRQDLLKSFTELNEAKKLLEVVPNDYSDSGDFDEALEKYNEYVNSYNSIIGTINDDYSKVVSMTSSLNGMIVGSTGITLSMIAYAIFKFIKG